MNQNYQNSPDQVIADWNRRFTTEETDLLKNSFKDNLPLIKAIRKVFLQIKLSEKEELAIKGTIKGDVFKILYKSFLPKIDGDAPIKGVLDLMMTVDLVARMPEDSKWHLRARQKLIVYLEERLAVLNGGELEGGIDFNSLVELTDNDVEDYINVMLRNTILNHIEHVLENINIVANQVDLTEEEQAEVNKLNSNK